PLGTYQLILGPLASVFTLLWLISVRSRWTTVLFVIFATCTFGAAVLRTKIVPRMEYIRLAGVSAGSAEYSALHAHASRIYISETAVLLIGAIILPLAIVESSRQKDSKSSVAKDSQA